MKYWNTCKVMELCFVCVLVLSINPLGASAAEYFVATTGNNSNSGTLGSPFRTLEKAASVMASGDTMFIRGGTYKRGSGALAVPSGGGSWVTATIIKAYEDEEVILTPYDETTRYGSNILTYPTGSSWIIADGLILDGLNHSGGKGGKNGFETPTNGHHLRVINTEIRYTGSHGVQTSGTSSYVELINVHIHHINHLRAPGHAEFLVNNYGVYWTGYNHLIQGCDIHHNRGYGIHHFASDGGVGGNALIGNNIHENEGSGILIWSGSGTIVANNLSWGNGTWASEGKVLGRYGIDVNERADDTLVYNNTTYGNAGGEFLLGAFHVNRVLIRNNIFFGTQANTYTVTLSEQTTYPGTGHVLSNNNIYHANTSFRLQNKAGAAATVENNSNDDPLFVNAKDSAFHLQSDSPAIGKGIVLAEVKTDFYNIQRNQPYDIGAYVFVGSATVVDTTPPASPRSVIIH